LHELSGACNAVAHPKPDAADLPGPAPDLSPHWQAVVADEADAFLPLLPNRLHASKNPDLKPKSHASPQSGVGQAG
jgi:hypothetical protein